MKDRGRAGGDAGGGQESHLRYGQAGQDGLGPRGVSQGHALDAGGGVVFDIHVGVDHIVENRPGHVTGVEASGRGEGGRVRHQIEAQGGEAHDGTPGEGEAEHELRVVGDSFGERIGRDQAQGRDAVVET